MRYCSNNTYLHCIGINVLIKIFRLNLVISQHYMNIVCEKVTMKYKYFLKHIYFTIILDT